jgi:hypothetical protein
LRLGGWEIFLRWNAGKSRRVEGLSKSSEKNNWYSKKNMATHKVSNLVVELTTDIFKTKNELHLELPLLIATIW